MLMRTRISRFSLCLALPIALSACGTAGKNAETRFYLLSSLPTTTVPLTGVRRQPPLAVTLSPVTLPQYLERPQIVIRIAQNRLELSEFDNWGGSLEKNMTRALATNLSMLLGTPDIRIVTSSRAAKHDARVDIHVMQFERGPNGRAVLNTRWRLFGPGRDQAPKITRVSRLVSSPIPASSPQAGIDRTADVAAMSRLLGELSETIARAIVQDSGS